MATARNMFIILDLHNSARYLMSKDEFIIGIYPNPFQENFTITINNLNYNLKIYNSLGQLITKISNIEYSKTIKLNTVLKVIKIL